ncbi:Sir2 family NAD-dependent protein deacetylase [Bradyrhizobium sp. CCBAU 45321]|uniref:SIR2 family NAD-dependent protein deacylase n=1 Tax=Bradyrhizobium sp. CCBAU 45321 TaxID=1641878 RepID=UPI0023021ACE|nr:SIR2 family protein [Bradyrhizobium sp. CCBAU 45321]MDA9545684.1 Sir2 family NAD-dependent protein deacetylase [Bradyrhizobium sp. CCBAU 45321]
MDQQTTGLISEERPPHDILAAAIERRRAVLFVGAGVSMAVGLPSWQSLIDHLLDDLGLDRNVIDGMHGGYQMLAEYYRIKRGGIGPLRSWLDRNWRVDPEKIAASELHRMIVELDFPVIYTTNYDRNLETAFDVLNKPFAKISNAKEIASARAGVTHIIKFHGDFDDDASLVLTETDFLNRLAFNSPLDIRFRADALGSTLLFVGYSMSDPNIRLLLHRIWQIWDESGHSQDRPRSFVFVAQRNPVQEAVLANWGITTIAPPDGMAADDGLRRLLRDIRERRDGRTAPSSGPDTERHR